MNVKQLDLSILTLKIPVFCFGCRTTNMIGYFDIEKVDKDHNFFSGCPHCCETMLSNQFRNYFTIDIFDTYFSGGYPYVTTTKHGLRCYGCNSEFDLSRFDLDYNVLLLVDNVVSIMCPVCRNLIALTYNEPKPTLIIKYMPIAITTDIVVTAGFYGAGPEVLVVKRKEWETDKLALPGGHFDAGQPHYDDHDCMSFVFGDVSVLDCALRELKEETGIVANKHSGPTGDGNFQDEPKLLMILDSPSRDPRPDTRRISIVYWINFSMPVKVKADDDVADAFFKPLYLIQSRIMAFDHGNALELIKKMHGKR